MGRSNSLWRSRILWAYFSIPTFSFLALAILYAFQFFFSAPQVCPVVYDVALPVPWLDQVDLRLTHRWKGARPRLLRLAGPCQVQKPEVPRI